MDVHTGKLTVGLLSIDDHGKVTNGSNRKQEGTVFSKRVQDRNREKIEAHMQVL